MTKRLSEILTIHSDFNFFKSIANLEPFELQNLQIVIDDLINYTLQTEQVFEAISKDYKESIEADYDWIHEGYEKFYEVYRNIESIDSVVLQALNLLENNIDDSQIGETDIFDKLDSLNEKSLFIKKRYLTPLKFRVDMTIEYNEIYYLTMNSINKELENCLKKCFKIHEKRFSSPVRHAPSFNLDILTKKLLQQRDQLKLPFLSAIDGELYEEYLDLKVTIDPIEASLKYIPSRIESFEKNYGTLLKLTNLDKLLEKYEDLVSEFNYLNNEVRDLKYDLVDSRWNEIFSYLNTEISFLISSVSKEVAKVSRFDKESERESSFRVQILKRLRYVTGIVESTFTLINQAIDEDLIDFKVVEKSNELANDWLKVKEEIPRDIMDKIEEDSAINETNNGTNDDVVHTFKKLSLEVKNDDEHDDIKSTPLKDKRRSRAGQFLMGKMNLLPVMIENDPTSVRKPDYNKVLTNSLRANQLEFDEGDKLDVTNLLKNIPNLQKRDNTSLFPAASPQVHEGTLAQLTGEVPFTPLKDSLVNFETPVPKQKIVNTEKTNRDTTHSTASANISKLKSGNFASKIPRPVSRLGPVSERSYSRLGATASMGLSRIRPATSLAISRPPTFESPKSKVRHSLQVHSAIIDEIDTRIPQPTPVRAILERGSSRLSDTHHYMRFEQSSSALSTSRSSSRVSSRPGSSMDGRPPPSRPTWR